MLHPRCLHGSLPKTSPVLMQRYACAMAARIHTTASSQSSMSHWMLDCREAICLCGTQNCRGSFLTFSGSRAFQQVRPLPSVTLLQCLCSLQTCRHLADT